MYRIERKRRPGKEPEMDMLIRLITYNEMRISRVWDPWLSILHVRTH
jgi:hypothetical protein